MLVWTCVIFILPRELESSSRGPPFLAVDPDGFFFLCFALSFSLGSPRVAVSPSLLRGPPREAVDPESVSSSSASRPLSSPSVRLLTVSSFSPLSAASHSETSFLELSLRGRSLRISSVVIFLEIFLTGSENVFLLSEQDKKAGRSRDTLSFIM